MGIKFSNNATTTLASSILSTDTSITVAGSFGSLFPAAGGSNYFYATIVNSSNDIEVVKVTSRSGDVMTVLRGQDGTTALNWIGGDKFELRVNAKALSDIASGSGITELNGVTVGLDDPQDAEFLNVVASSLSISGIATGVTPSAGDSSSNLATTAFVQGAGLPTGIIVLWSGSSAAIPAGWNLCNGSNGTPDLRNRFIVGAGSTYAVGATGGSANAVLVSHTHTGTSSVTDPGHTHVENWNNTGSGNFVANLGSGSTVTGYAPSSTGAATAKQVLTNSSTTGISVSTSISTEGSSGTNANLPPYYALCYIMKA